MIVFAGILVLVLIPQGGPQEPGEPPSPARFEWAMAHQDLLTRLEKERTHFDREWNKLDARLLQIEARYDVIWSSVGLTIVVFIGLLVSILSWANSYIKKKIGTLVDDNRVAVEEMVRQADMDRAIRTRERILVIAGPGRAPVSDYLKQKLHFRHVTLEIIAEGAVWNDALFADMAETRFDLVIFDHLDAGQIDNFIDHSTMTVFVAFKTGDRVDLKRENLGMVNFANSLMTLYARIQEAARYRKALETA